MTLRETLASSLSRREFYWYSIGPLRRVEFEVEASTKVEPLQDIRQEMADDLETEFQKRLVEAIEEAYANNNNKLARALQTARDYMMRSNEVVLNRLQDIGVYAMSKEERDSWKSLVAEQIVREAKLEAERKSVSLWQNRSAKFAIVFGAIGAFVSLVTIAASTVLNRLNGFPTHH